MDILNSNEFKKYINDFDDFYIEFQYNGDLTSNYQKIMEI